MKHVEALKKAKEMGYTHITSIYSRFPIKIDTELKRVGSTDRDWKIIEMGLSDNGTPILILTDSANPEDKMDYSYSDWCRLLKKQNGEYLW